MGLPPKHLLIGGNPRFPEQGVGSQRVSGGHSVSVAPAHFRFHAATRSSCAKVLIPLEALDAEPRFVLHTTAGRGELEG